MTSNINWRSVGTAPTRIPVSVHRRATAAADSQTRSTYAGGDAAGTTTPLARLPTFPANFSSLVISAGGVVNEAMVAILGTALTETVAGYLTAGF